MVKDQSNQHLYACMVCRTSPLTGRTWVSRVDLCSCHFKFSTHMYICIELHQYINITVCSLALVTRLQNSFTSYHSTPIKPLRYFGQHLILSKVTTLIKFNATISFKNVYCLSLILSQPIIYHQLAQDIPKYVYFIRYREVLRSRQNHFALLRKQSLSFLLQRG